MATAVTQQTVQSTIFEALEKLGAEPEQLSREATFDALDIDSLDLVEVAQIVEEEFGVLLKGEDVEKLTTVGDAIDVVVDRAA